MKAPVLRGAVGAGLPIAASVRREDPHFNSQADRMRVDVFLDGALVTDVISYDVAAGEVVRYLRDSRRRIFSTGSGWARETLRGCVEVRYAGRCLLRPAPAKATAGVS